MDSNDDEDTRLRAVTLENARTIFLARRRAEEQLVRTKEELERRSRELANSLAMVRATLESTTDAILVTDADGNVTGSNAKFAELWRLPAELLDAPGQDGVLQFMSHRSADPAAFVARVVAIRTSPTPDSFDLLELVDGSVFERFSMRQIVDGRNVGRVWSFRDVTERRRAEAALRASETELRLMLDHAPVHLIRCSRDRRFLFVNRGYAERFGLRRREVVGRSIQDVLGPAAYESIRPHIDAVLTGRRVDFEQEIPYRLISARFMHCVLEPERDASGEVEGWVAVLSDITERKRAEQALRESEAQFRQLADALPQIVWTARPDGFVDYYNERWYEFTGQPREAFGDESWLPVLHPDDARRTRETYYGCIAGGNLYQIEYRFKDRRTGGYRWFLGRAYPVRDDRGRIVRWFGTSTDIDDTKQTEQITRFLADASAALAELTDYTSTLHRVADLAVPAFADWCAVDMLEPDGVLRRLAVTHADPAQAELAQELFARYPPRSTDAHGPMRVLRSGETEWLPSIPDEMLVELAQDDEHLRILRQLAMRSCLCVPLRSRSRTIGVLSFVTAESGRVFDSVDLAAAEDLAHRTVIAIENARLVTALKDSDRRKDEFLAMLAHELRNPLAPIRNVVQIYQANTPATPELQWATEVIDRQVHQMTRLVDDLLDVSRITRGRIELRKEHVELVSVINNAVVASRALVEKWGHELTVTLPREPIRLEADPTRLEQVVLNLLNNAAKYTNQGGRIWVDAERHDGHVSIRVKDTGIGIPAEMLPRVFDMFTQVEVSLERSQGGLGIGLTLVRVLVEMHGGTVEARSAGPGQGSEFEVRLPISAESAEGPGEQAPARPTELPPRCRILVVDDNGDAADSMGRLLRALGNEVRTAYDGLEGVALAGSFRPDVVLLDIGLPKLNGYEAARRIRALPGGAGIILVALTGWGQAADRRRSREAGFDHHLTKPVEVGALQSLLLEHRPPAPSQDQPPR